MGFAEAIIIIDKQIKEFIGKYTDSESVFPLLTIAQCCEIINGDIYSYSVDGKDYFVVDGKNIKVSFGQDYHYTFNKANGDFKRWGISYEDDPDYSPIGPEILDLEISVNGCPNACKFCYKNNTNAVAKNMSFETFRKIIDSFPKTLTQIAFGITGIQTNPDFIRMMEYCREIGIVPNFTLSGIDLTDEMAKKCASLVGAVAVSAYDNDVNVCYNAVKKFTDLGLNQTNIHVMVSDKTLDFANRVAVDRINDERLKDMNAIVFLGVKPKGRAKGDVYRSASTADFGHLMEYCMKNNVAIGFDSCSAPKFEEAIKNFDCADVEKKMLIACSESCESSLFSSYINADGFYWHCSFCEGEDGYESVNCLEVDDFMEVWNSDIVKKFRQESIATAEQGCRRCNVFPSINP